MSYKRDSDGKLRLGPKDEQYRDFFEEIADKDATIASLREENERLKGEVQQLCLDASPPPDPPKSIKLVSGVQGKSGGVHQPRKQASPEAAPDAVGFPPDTDITDCALIAALRARAEAAEAKVERAYAYAKEMQEQEINYGNVDTGDTLHELMLLLCKDNK